MKVILILLLNIGAVLLSHGQREYHVFPVDHESNPGSTEGDGSLTKPWDLQTALGQSSDVVNGNDTIWLHEGVYNGRFVSKLQSITPNTYVTVSGYKNDKVILNGNIQSDRVPVLDVTGKQVIYQNFEVTYLGDFSRFEGDSDFHVGSGIRHLKGANCKFYNLKIHDVPGLGFGFWKHGEASVIENCLIYNNGYVAENGKGRGEGIYVQNASDTTRLIKNNIIFNNYYKGIEAWSAGKRARREVVKHISITNNILFNNGLPSGNYYDNIIVASNDRNGINVAKYITLTRNVLYHNTRFSKDNEFWGDAPSLTLGFKRQSPVEDIVVRNNVIIGRSNGLRILEAKTLDFTNNIIYTSFVQFGSSASENASNWIANNNKYFTKTKRPPFRIVRVKDYKFVDWQSTFGIDLESTSKSIFEFELHSILAFNQNTLHPNRYHVALFDKDGNDVAVNVFNYGLMKGQNFKIFDVENPEVVLSSGSVPDHGVITFPMQSQAFKSPSHNSKAFKTPSNFGVFIVEFENLAEEESKQKEDNDNFLKRFFEWLGF